MSLLTVCMCMCSLLFFPATYRLQRGRSKMGKWREYFVPEESFESWGSYMSALRSTWSRLKDRFKARSLAEVEVNEIAARSQHQMKKNLTWWDLMWFGVGAVVGSGIFVLTGLEASTHSGPAVVVSYAISGLSALLSVFCYTEFAVEIPVAGGAYAYLKVELGDFVAFLAAGNILFQYAVSGAAVARSWTSYFATLCNFSPSKFRIQTNLPQGVNAIDLVAVGILIVTCILACKGTKFASRFNSVASAVKIFVIVFIVLAGLFKADKHNLSDFMPFGVRGVFTSASVLFFAYVGFDAVSTMAEETKNPARDIPIGLVGSMIVIIASYCLLALTLVLMEDYRTIDADAPFTVAFHKVGMNWAKYIVALGALKGMTTVLMVSIVGQARYLTHIARTHLLPPWFGFVQEKTGTPVNATVVMVVVTAIIAVFTDLGILANLLSISTLLVFSLVAIGLLVRRYYVSGVTEARDQKKLVGFLAVILAASTAIAVYWALSDGWIGYVVITPIWFLGTLGLQIFVPQARRPKLYGAPCVPWVPALSLGVNSVLLGSIDRASYVRFAISTVIMLAYYLLFGLHASYDTAKASQSEPADSTVKV